MQRNLESRIFEAFKIPTILEPLRCNVKNALMKVTRTELNGCVRVRHCSNAVEVSAPIFMHFVSDNRLYPI